MWNCNPGNGMWCSPLQTNQFTETFVYQGIGAKNQQTPPRNEMGFIVSTDLTDVQQVPQIDTMARKVRGGCILPQVVAFLIEK